MRGKMEAKTECVVAATHVLIFPCPAQGHVNSMLKLAQLLAFHQIHVTFVNTENVHQRLLRFGHIEALLSMFPTLQFKTIDDGLPHDHPRSGVHFLISVALHAKPLLRDILLSQSPDGKPKITCLIGDSFFGGLTADIAHEIGIPVIHYLTISASSFWTLFCVPNLFESNELPIKGVEDMDRVITNIPGMENLLRCRDLPNLCQQTDLGPLKYIVSETHQNLRANAFILNTFEDLESPALSQMRDKFPRLFVIGPVHAHLSSKIASKTETTPLWEEDRSCMTWLDSQPLKSVIYVSFGSSTKMKKEDMMEIWHGLVKSKSKFLWVVRPNMVIGKTSDEDEATVELKESTKDKGCIVGWAPQEEVLAHKAIGGFLTHSGCNSTLEGVVAGVPMISKPYIADQQTNGRFVSEVWKIGLDMKDVCDRNVVEKMVNDVMVQRKEEFMSSAQVMAMLAHKSVSRGGSSYSNLEDLIHYIKSFSQDTNK